MSKDMDLSKTYGKQLADNATKPELVALKTTFKKLVHKAAEETGEIIGNKSLKKIVKPKPAENSRNAEDIIIQPEETEDWIGSLEKRTEWIKTIIIKCNNWKYLNY